MKLGMSYPEMVGTLQNAEDPGAVKNCPQVERRPLSCEAEHQER